MAALKTPSVKKFACRSACCKSVLLALLGFAYSPSLMATPLDSWEHRCVAEDDSDDKVCTTELRSRDKDIEAIFYFARGPNGPVPFVALSEEAKFGRLSVKVDDEGALEADSCDDGICYFETEKSSQLLRQFRGGRAAHIVIDGPDGQTLFDSEITLMGFSAAYKLY